MGDDSAVGGDPQGLGRCTECGEVYPVQIHEDGDVRPIGTDGVCSCGNDSFVALADE